MNQWRDAGFVPAISLERRAGRPLWLQLVDGLRSELVSRRPPSGTPLPSTRELARMLGVARGTAVAAYEQLVAEGCLTGRRGAGHYVAELPAAGAAEGARRGSPAPPQPAATPDLFRPGQPDLRLFPRLEWSRCMARAWRRRNAWAQGADPFGDPDLRRAIAQHLVVWRSIRTSPEQIVITAGSIGGLELLFRALPPSPDCIAIEEPGYPVIRHLAAGFGHRVRGIPVDGAGMRVEMLAGSSPLPALVIVTPSRQFPLGHLLAPERRRVLLDWAEASHAFIVEDDYDSEYRYGGRPVPALAAMDRRGRVIYAGTFSKVFSAGIRLGYLVVPERLIGAIRSALRRFGTRASIVPQPALAMFLESGAFARHLRRTRRIYDARRRFLLDGLERRFGDLLRPGDTSGGMAFAVFPRSAFAPDFDDRALARAGAGEGFGFAALSDHFAEGPGTRGLLLGFAAHEEGEIAEGLDRLEALLEARILNLRRE